MNQSYQLYLDIGAGVQRDGGGDVFRCEVLVADEFLRVHGEQRKTAALNLYRETVTRKEFMGYVIEGELYDCAFVWREGHRRVEAVTVSRRHYVSADEHSVAVRSGVDELYDKVGIVG